MQSQDLLTWYKRICENRTEFTALEILHQILVAQQTEIGGGVQLGDEPDFFKESSNSLVKRFSFKKIIPKGVHTYSQLIPT